MENRISIQQQKKIVEQLGKKIKIERIMKNISVLELAEELDMGNSHLSRIENGVIDSPTITTYLNICSALHLKPSDFFSVLDELEPFKN